MLTIEARSIIIQHCVYPILRTLRSTDLPPETWRYSHLPIYGLDLDQVKSWASDTPGRDRRPANTARLAQSAPLPAHMAPRGRRAPEAELPAKPTHQLYGSRKRFCLDRRARTASF
jgi:hypothetical protein